MYIVQTRDLARIVTAPIALIGGFASESLPAIRTNTTVQHTVVKRLTRTGCIWCRYVNGQKRKKHVGDVLNGVAIASVEDGKRGRQSMDAGHVTLLYVPRAPVEMNIMVVLVSIINFFVILNLSYPVKGFRLTQFLKMRRDLRVRHVETPVAKTQHPTADEGIQIWCQVAQPSIANPIIEKKPKSRRYEFSTTRYRQE